MRRNHDTPAACVCCGLTRTSVIPENAAVGLCGTHLQLVTSKIEENGLGKAPPKWMKPYIRKIRAVHLKRLVEEVMDS